MIIILNIIMSFVIYLVDFVLMSVIILDTLGLVNLLRKTSSCEIKDYTRVCFTWIFFLVISLLTTCSSTGNLARLFDLFGLALRICISIPFLNGAEKIYHFLIEENKGMEYAKKGASFIQSFTGMSATKAEGECASESQ